MNEVDILEEFEKYVLSNKEVLSVLPVNNKKNKSKYIEKVQELEEKAEQIKKVIWTEICNRYEKFISVEENPKINELNASIKDLSDIELFNELNTPYEKLGFDRITHSLSCFFEGDLNLVNENIKLFVEKFKDYGIELSSDDFNYSQLTNEYMKSFFSEYNNGDISSETLKKTFETVYWKCPDIVTHIELNMRYLYFINSKKIERELKERNDRVLASKGLDKNGLVKKYFELNKELIKTKRVDAKSIMQKFVSGEWKIKDFNNKEMTVLYDRLSAKKYNEANEKQQEEINNNFGKLLNTLIEYNAYIKYKYIIDDLKVKYKNKDSFKNLYENKSKELRKKEQELIKENKKHNRIIRLSKNPLFVLFKKKMDRKIYEFPVLSNNMIKEIKKLYEELDEQLVNTRIAEYVDDNCTIKYMFKIAVSFYTYAYNLIKKHYEDDDVNIEEELQELIDFINQPYKVMLNNIKLAEEPEITSIISNRYKILNINLEKEDLEENLDNLIEDVEKIVDFHNIQKSDLNIEDIEFVEKVKPMINKK